MPRRTDDLYARWVAILARNRRRALVTLAWVAVSVVAALWVGRTIRLDTNLEALLSRTAPAVQALDRLRARQGAADYLYVAVKSKDPEANARMTAAIADEVREWPETIEVVVDRDFTTLRNHALYFLSVDELQRLRDRLQREHQRHVAKRLRPGLTDNSDIDLDQVLVGDDWDADLADAADAPAPSSVDTEAAPAPAIDELLREYREKLENDKRIPADLIDVIWPRETPEGTIEWEERVAEPFESPSREVRLVQARLSHPATDLAFAREVGQRVDRIVERLDPDRFAPGMLVKIGGPYMASREADKIVRDLGRATALSASLVALVLIVGFRSIRGLVVVLIPVAVSCAYTLAIAKLILGELNVLTAFLFAVLMGIGVDFAVHMHAMRVEQGPRPDWAAILRSHGRPLFASMVTTLGSFAVLLLADFKGFREFGLIAGIGVAVSLGVAALVVPAMDVAFGPLRGGPAGRPRLPKLAGYVGRHATWFRAALVLSVVVVAGLGAGDVSFETDMRELRAPETESEKGIAYSSALGSRSGTPVVVVAEEADQLDEAVRRLRASASRPLESAESKEPWLSDVHSLSLYLPRNQEEKHRVLEDIAGRAKAMLDEAEARPDDDPLARHRTHLRALHQLGSAPPLARDELPHWARAPFLEHEGRDDRLALVYTRLQAWDLGQVVEAANRFRELTGDLDVQGASSRFVLADVAVKVEKDALRLPPFALAVILLFIVLDLRRPIPALICFSSLALGLALTFGLMGIWEIRINFYNLVVMPAVVGLGIDASIHLWHARSLGSVRATARAAMISALTTAGGFAGLLIASHRGLQSIGKLGVLATLCCVVVAVLLLSADRWGQPRRA